MTKFIIVIGRKYFSSYVAQNNYWIIIQTKLSTFFFQKKKNIETKDTSEFVKKQKRFLWLKFKS